VRGAPGARARTARIDEPPMTRDDRARAGQLVTTLTKNVGKAVVGAGFRPGMDVALALDPAASEFWHDGAYVLARTGTGPRTTDQMVEWYRWLIEAFPIVSIEDGLGESNWDGWKLMTDLLGKKILVVGDDIFVTNPELIRRGWRRALPMQCSSS
jgi:enolase